jgi:hypothetical protein
VLTDHAVISFGFYHFACILLLTYKPGPKFAIHNAVSLSETNVGIFRFLILRLLMWSATNPGACSSHMRRVQVRPRDWTTLNHCLPHNIYLGTAGIGSKRTGGDRCYPRRFRTKPFLAHYLDHQCAQERVGDGLRSANMTSLEHVVRSTGFEMEAGLTGMHMLWCKAGHVRDSQGMFRRVLSASWNVPCLC